MHGLSELVEDIYDGLSEADAIIATIQDQIAFVHKHTKDPEFVESLIAKDTNVILMNEVLRLRKIVADLEAKPVPAKPVLKPAPTVLVKSKPKKQGRRFTDTVSVLPDEVFAGQLKTGQLVIVKALRDEQTQLTPGKWRVVSFDISYEKADGSPTVSMVLQNVDTYYRADILLADWAVRKASYRRDNGNGELDTVWYFDPC